MEALNRFLEVCQRKPVLLEDCVNSDYSDTTLVELFYVPVLFFLSFATTVYWLLRTSDGHPPLDETLDNPPLPMVNEGGDFNLMDEEPWEYREDYPSPY
ncbi:hypothetical protein AVEN_258280-1 [Araneus ventricosus]|uniref:Uncharacterized protein n=1 Tax=Araneus ventricosus TaxID=182803 RepID=A0A4Y2RJ30_ARAVE|nr:hypothetical protein AVEN_24494-1 [Araneus ventricosus]GBN75436.1 hypothetical protein AVEN_258280-1 [Araneus ventricosus]